MDGWCNTSNLNLCTAFATCGVDFTFERLLDEPTGQQSTRFFLALGSRGDVHISTPGMLRQVRSGDLERTDPSHPLVDCLQGLLLREMLVTWLKRGTRFKLVPVVGTNRATAIMGTEATLPVGELIRTSDLKLVAALMRSGLPCVGIEPGVEDRKFLIKPRGLFPEVDGVQLAKDIRSGELAKRDPGHPALWVMMALRNRDAIRAQITKGAELVLIRNARSAAWRNLCRSAVIYPDATSEAFDKVQRHLRIP